MSQGMELPFLESVRRLRLHGEPFRASRDFQRNKGIMQTIESLPFHRVSTGTFLLGTASCRAFACACSAVLLAISTPAFAADVPQGTDQAQPVAAMRVERGRYLVTQLGLCTDCHSPHNERGEPVAGRHLTGAQIPFKPVVKMPWATFAPPLAGLPEGFSEEQLAHFLMTGERPNGRPAALPPMPPYRMNRDDAEAVVAYLRSLPATDAAP